MSLFKAEPQAPLAERLRPKHLDELVGQSHLLGEGKPLRLSFSAARLHSMILWGPPGVGKTTIAKLTAEAFSCEWIALPAAFSGVKDIRAAVERAEDFLIYGKQTVLFIDELHRFNKTQQDALLPYTESGLITFIGATTENPSFAVTSALLSRAQVYVLKSLSDEELKCLFHKAYDVVLSPIEFADDALELIIATADGDARRLFNCLEQLHTACTTVNKLHVSREFVLHALGQNTKRFDKHGDKFYEQISALHKSVRGSDPDAALYWLCRMLDAGVDPHYLARRIVRMAWEDIGLADPRAIQLANEAAATYECLGTPEGELALGQAVIYLSIAAKSNAGYLAFNKAMDFVKKNKSQEVPMHLRNAPTELMKELGYGHQYRYAHDEPHAYAAAEHYLPDGMPNPGWYQPVNRGLEIKIAEKLAFLSTLDDKAKN